MPYILPGWMDYKDNIPRLTFDEHMFSDVKKDKNKLKMLTQEKKSVAVMQDLVDRMSNRANIMFDNCIGSYVTASAPFLPLIRFCVVSEHESD